MKNVMYVVPSSGIGGAETFLLHTAEFHRGYRPVYACFREGVLVEKLRASGHVVRVMPNAPRLSRPRSFLKAVRWLAKVAREEKIDLVHSTMAYGALFGSPAALLAGLPHCWFQHGPVGSWQDRLAAQLPSRFVIANSRYTMAQQGKMGSRRLRSLRLGVTGSAMEADEKIEVRKNLIAEFAKSGERVEFISTMICRPQPQKGIELWIEATRLLRARGKNAACLLMGGEPGSYLDQLVRMAEEKDVPLLWRSFSSSPWAEAQGADALVCASISPEGYGLTLAEGNFHGLAVIAPREGGPLDLVVDGRNGFFFEPRSASSLAAALQKFADAPELASEVGARGRHYALANFSAADSIRRLEESYAHLWEKP